MKMIAVFTALIIFFSFEQTVNSAAVKGNLEELISKLIRPTETVVFAVGMSSGEDYFSLIRNMKNPALIVKLPRPHEKLQNLPNVHILYAEEKNNLDKQLRLLTMSGTFHQGTFYIITNNISINDTQKVCLKHYLSKVTVLQRESTKILKRKLGMSEILNTYSVIKLASYVAPQLDRITILTPVDVRPSKNSDSYTNAITTQLHKSISFIAKGFKASLQYKTGYLGRFKILGIKEKRNELVIYHSWSGQIYKPSHQFNVIGLFFRESKKWMIPRIQKPNNAVMLITTFRWDAWILVSGTFLIIVVACRCLAGIFNETTSMRNVPAWMVILFRLLLGMSTPTFPKSATLRVFLVLFIFYCFFLSNLFLGYLTTVLTDPDDEEDISTIEELAASGIGIVGTAELSKYYKDTLADPVSMKIYNKMMVRNWYYIEDYAVNNSYGVVADQDIFYQTFPHTKLKYYALDYVVRDKIHNLVVKRGHAWFERLQTLCSAFAENGFRLKLLRDIVQLNIKTDKPGDGTENIYVRLIHLKPVIFVFIGGLAFSTLVLIGEILYHRLTKKTSMNKHEHETV